MCTETGFCPMTAANPAVCSEMLAALLNPQQRHNRMIGELAARALAGSRPLPGNLVLAPLAGTAVALQVGDPPSSKPMLA